MRSIFLVLLLSFLLQERAALSESSEAFKNHVNGLSAAQLATHNRGDAQFDRDFSLESAGDTPLLGPKFNHVSCVACHINDGRGPGKFGLRGSDYLIKLNRLKGVPPVKGAPIPDPLLGTELQDHAISGVLPEGKIKLTWLRIRGRFSDGESYELRRPRLQIRMLKGYRFGSDTQVSLRLPPPLIGMGFLEAVSDASLRELERKQKVEGHVSGRVNISYDMPLGKYTVGKFGFKAGSPTVIQQSAAAYFNDIGISNSIFNGGVHNLKIAQSELEETAFYLRTLAAPPRRNITDDKVKRGEKMFSNLGCASCHVKELITAPSIVASLSEKSFNPYTDLLLHDMGPGLADRRPEFQASGREWRTSPLWGLGYTDEVLGAKGRYLHDGRARSLIEAILWHGGEARESKEAFRTSNSSDRDSLIAFLKSL